MSTVSVCRVEEVVWNQQVVEGKYNYSNECNFREQCELVCCVVCISVEKGRVIWKEKVLLFF